METNNNISSNSKNGIYYVGIGASAGGLEALQDFFQAMPDKTGMAFIVIQHLSPDYKSLMDELLARCTNMSINIVKDGMKIKPDNIYLIPPRKNMSVFHGKLYLEDQQIRKGLNLPIDIFFRSLAAEKGKHAISIVLSGTGSDGTLGIRSIKENGGMVMVQDDHSAKFDGMPRSSISTGLVDYVLPAEKMAEELLNYIKHPFVQKGKFNEQIISKDVDTMTKIILALRDYCGVDFSYYKENTIIRRLERRVSINRFNSLEEYMIFLLESDKEKETLYRELLIGVTSFFRDREAFQHLKEKVLPSILFDKKTVRIWSVGCSTGEEVYSICMLLMEYMREKDIDCDIKVFATDIDRHSLDVAGQGFYPDSVMADVEPYLLSRYFSRKENGYQVNDSLRKMVVFATHNLLKDPHFSKLDLLVCRNLFIYFKSEMQQKLLSMFFHSLNQEGYLFMGSSETIGEMGEAFSVIDNKWKIYKPKRGYKPEIIKDLPMPKTRYAEERSYLIKKDNYNGTKIDKLLENTISIALSPSVIVDEDDNIVHIVNDVSPFFKIKPGNFTKSIYTNLNDELSLFVSNILRRLKSGEKEISFQNISGTENFNNNKIHIRGLAIPFEGYSFYLLTFLLENASDTDLIDKTSNNSTIDMELEVNNRVNQLEKELKTTKENLHATVEELETSNEELQSSNE